MKYNKWRHCRDLTAMLRYVRDNPRQCFPPYYESRRARLFLVTACRRYLEKEPDPEYAAIVDQCELHHQGETDQLKLQGIWRQAIALIVERTDPALSVLRSGRNKLADLYELANMPTDLSDLLRRSELQRTAWLETDAFRDLVQYPGSPTWLVDRRRCYRCNRPLDPLKKDWALLSFCKSCGLDGPFWRDIVEFTWPRYITPAVLQLAEQVTRDRRPVSGHIEPLGLQVLADMLEENGCDHQEVLKHLRDTRHPHFLGCWVLEYLRRPLLHP